MLIKFTRNTAAGGQHYAAGETADVTDAVGRLIVSIGKAVPADQLAPAVIETDTPRVAEPPAGLTPEGKRGKRKSNAE